MANPGNHAEQSVHSCEASMKCQVKCCSWLEVRQLLLQASYFGFFFFDELNELKRVEDDVKVLVSDTSLLKVLTSDCLIV